MSYIFIMGSRGYKRNYGGWETLVDNLIENWDKSDDTFIVYELTSIKADKNKILIRDNVICPQIYVATKGNISMVIFAIKALFHSLKYIKDFSINKAILYVLGIRIGPFFYLLKNKIKHLKCKVVINPDGLEWRRDKWNRFVKFYFLISEYFMLVSSDGIISDSKVIQTYIKRKYRLESIYASYGAYINSGFSFNEDEIYSTLNKYNLRKNDYFLIVGRFVPENNFELIIKEFINSKTTKNLIIISNFSKNKFYNNLLLKTKFHLDQRIVFLGSIYDKKVIRIIRENAYCYIHGHSAGGTNPSLLESMTTTKLNFIFDVDFNREVIGENGMYFGSSTNSLVNLINQSDTFSQSFIDQSYSENLIKISTSYSWKIVVMTTKNLFSRLSN